MGNLVMLVVVLAGCSNKRMLDGERVEVLALPTCTIAVPAGWNVTTEAGPVPPGAKVLVLDHAVEGFLPSIVVQELAMGAPDHEAIVTATDKFCHDSILIPISTQQDTNPGRARAVTIGTFRGCDVEMRDKKTAQAGRQIALSNGKGAVSFVCNRDQNPPAGVDVDGACDALARAITPK